MAKLFLGSTELSDTSKVSTLENTTSNLSEQIETMNDELEGLETLLASI